MVDASTCFLVCAAHAWDSVDMKSEDPVSTQVDGDLWRLHSQASSGSGYRDSCLKVGALSQVVTPTPESLRWLKSHTWCVRPWIDKLKIPLTNLKKAELADRAKKAGFEMAKQSKDAKGQRRVSGGRHLKESGAYPLGFGSRVAAPHVEWQDIWQQIW